MYISVFDLFKVGIGPSSSHTVGPMVAARRFLDGLAEAGLSAEVARVRVYLHGSLAFTGKGHGTDAAVLLGLSGQTPEEIDPDAVSGLLGRIRSTGRLSLGGEREIAFAEDDDVVFDFDHMLPGHSNGMRFEALDDAGGQVAEQIYYSIGGGFVATPHETLIGEAGPGRATVDLPHPFANAAEMLTRGREAGLTVAEMMRANEAVWRPADEVTAGLDRIWAVMKACMDRGMRGQGILPGGLKVRRRAAGILAELRAGESSNMKMPHGCLDWLSLYAIAVNEENAAGGRIVTAPTNGAAGVIPAVIRYYTDFCPGADAKGVRDFLLAAGAVGGLIKLNASISGAEAGCQGEIGSASAMAAAGLATALGASNEQVENAAEIALEHHLGMTCDPVAGLVQVPCIERNAMGAVKAVNAASLAMKGDGTHFVSLDAAIETMRQTGVDMQSKYKETSQGGLAVNVVAC